MHETTPENFPDWRQQFQWLQQALQQQRVLLQQAMQLALQQALLIHPKTLLSHHPHLRHLQTRHVQHLLQQCLPVVLRLLC